MEIKEETADEAGEDERDSDKPKNERVAKKPTYRTLERQIEN